MNRFLLYPVAAVKAVFAGIGHVLSDDFKKSTAPALIEFISMTALFGVYFFGALQLSHGFLGAVVAAGAAGLLVLLFMVFVDTVFQGPSRLVRVMSALAMVIFMTFAALMTSTLLYQSNFVTGYANERAFAAVNTLTVFASQATRDFTAAASRYRAAADQSRARADTERRDGGTCNDGSNRGINGPRNVWRDSFATQTTADANEIGGMTTEMEGLSREIKAFGQAFDPNKAAVMQATWSSLTARLQAVTTDSRIPQLINQMRGRLDAADRGIGTEISPNGKAHVVTCSDPDLRAAGESAIVALQAIKAPPQLADSIVGADIESSVRRVFVLAGHPFHLSDEVVHSQEYVIFLLALFLEFMFVFTKAISNVGKSIGPERNRGISVEPLGPILKRFTTAWRDDAKHEFRELESYILKRDDKRVRLGIPEGATQARVAIEVLVTAGHAEYVGRLDIDDLKPKHAARVSQRRASSLSYVDLYEMPASTWSAFTAATSLNETHADSTGPSVH